jgi:hypothetical protein
VKIFNQSQPGSFTLVDPRVKFIFSNSFGIPVRSTFSRADGRDIQGNAVALTGYPNPFNIPYSLTPGTVAIDSFELNKSNSNFSAYVGNEPYWNFFEYDIDLNPLGSSNRNWVTDSSVVECKAVFEIPLYGTAKNYSLESKIPLDLHEIDFNVLDSLLFRLHTENGFPIDIRLQLYFEDSTTATIYDSLFISDLLIMPSADVDGNGLVQEIHPKTIDVMFDRMRLLNIQGANRLRLTGDFNTLFEGSTQPDVRLYEFYSILIQMGIQAKFNIVE